MFKIIIIIASSFYWNIFAAIKSFKLLYLWNQLFINVLDGPYLGCWIDILFDFLQGTYIFEILTFRLRSG